MTGSQIATLGLNEKDPAQQNFVIRELSGRLSLTSDYMNTVLQAANAAAARVTLGLSYTAGSVLFAGGTGDISQNNANFFWDDTNKRLGLGLATPAVTLHLQYTSALQFFIDYYGATAGVVGRYANGTPGSPTQCVAGDILNAFNARGYHNGAAFATSSTGFFRFRAQESFTATNQGTDWVLATTAKGAIAATMRIGVPPEGGFVVGVAALATNATDGFLYIPTCAGPPTGTPTTQTGTVPMIFDTTNNKFYIFNGTWKGGTNPGTFT